MVVSAWYIHINGAMLGQRRALLENRQSTQLWDDISQSCPEFLYSSILLEIKVQLLGNC